MSSSVATLEILKTQRILPLFYHADATVCSGVVKALYDGGVRMVEFTNRGDQALARFTELRAMCEQSLPGMNLAVGTISTKTDAENFIKAGAKVLISPFWDDDVFAVAKSAEVLWIPGCMTPTEIHRCRIKYHQTISWKCNWDWICRSSATNISWNTFCSNRRS